MLVGAHQLLGPRLAAVEILVCSSLVGPEAPHMIAFENADPLPARAV